MGGRKTKCFSVLNNCLHICLDVAFCLDVSKSSFRYQFEVEMKHIINNPNKAVWYCDKSCYITPLLSVSGIYCQVFGCGSPSLAQIARQ